MVGNPLRPFEHIHFVGIGGSGMSGIAQVLLELGHRVSGSDLVESAAVQRLRASGARVELGHCRRHLGNADVVVVSSAVAGDNPEVLAAQSRGIPVVPRAMMLAELMRGRAGIAIAGSHGKTTTTSLTVEVFRAAALDPGFVIGGVLQGQGTSAAAGEGSWFIAEADESDASFLHLSPATAVITNIDRDHLETYDHDFERLRAAFVEFAHRLPFWGHAVVCLDDARADELVRAIDRPVLTYGLSADADIRGEVLSRHTGGTRIRVSSSRLPAAIEMELSLAGDHNVRNALAALSVAAVHDVDLEVATEALGRFAGVARRFHVTPEVALGDSRVVVVDDYGHHPTELRALLRTAREQFPGTRLVLAFQPHRYSRTRDLFPEFVEVLAAADLLVLADVYAAGEEAISGADANALAAALEGASGVEVVRCAGMETIADCVARLARDGDVVLMAGAGNIGRVAADFRELAK